jgi:hypothetical protein
MPTWSDTANGLVLMVMHLTYFAAAVSLMITGR